MNHIKLSLLNSLQIGLTGYLKIKTDEIFHLINIKLKSRFAATCE
jgi:hypothetical protein